MPIVYGSIVDHETRCIHYHTQLDIIAIKFKCCQKYYPCYQCHNEHELHEIERWPEHEFDIKAVMCGVCRHEMTINKYMLIENCPQCSAHFNNRCKFHYHLYFVI
ncbi:hypothetical protein H6Y62_10515 [Staphylococcus lugdunensis]|jgi:uncharacterized CHY-type Zn-finger protein|uniref:CHY zinc finger n=1 Tax=Staphylococcus lugdunensis TaxID=28035 RepID=A0A133Q1J9_STALU|nr:MULTISPECIES: CHY zinc finger protein [Staphylococcus]AMG61275.1 hypothetical protein AL499_04740 [Staphylococcus lugdunensis]AMG64831.1 hypothetical protein AL501_11440 [Staphylococcus lugdunensis]ARB78377.1 hypothetical protein A6J61_08680 [Staphylococcus lugdunensis]ARJ09909.1 hypothetical protein B7454_11040 [Staphylococcus lugdunensis]ARJ12091.1 hypothetical protein B7466_09960 [Staphylococcus lugdunensis]